MSALKIVSSIQTRPPANSDAIAPGSLSVETIAQSRKKSANIKGFTSWSVGAKLTIFNILLVGVVLLGLIALINRGIASNTIAQATQDLQSKTRLVVGMLDVFDSELRNQVATDSRIFKAGFKDGLTLDGTRMVDVAGVPTPALKAGSADLNGEFSEVDAFTAQTGAVATVFVGKDGDFIRISTSLKKENGERALGTALDHAHPAFKNISEGKSYTGIATLFGKQYMTQYEPIVDQAGKVIGIYFVGLDFTESIKRVKESIRAVKIGKSGYFYALDANEGKNFGTLTIHPAKEGQNILESKDSDGNEFIKDILQRREGVATYPWINKELGETEAREKTVAFAPMKNWNWVVAGGVYVDEYTEVSNSLARRYQLIGLLLLLVMGGALYFIMRRRLSVPLQQVTEAAQRLAHGDLTVSLAVTRVDEIGQMMNSINGIGQGLAEVVNHVRESAAHISQVSQEVANGNADLSARTESQASSLEQTAASMEELTGTVKQNADSAQQANQLVMRASQVATKGGEAVTQVLDTMDSIKQSSNKIVDIISVIDGIAFQTNILALNAAVEAARAGEQGRGFAVVATEVRNLAQRSAGAAKEIAALIKDSVAKVNDGHALAEQAGMTMSDIVDSVQQVAQIMGEISHAGKEQSSGIDQVNQAIAHMDEMTQQNAALVEQAAAATESMHEEALGLVQDVNKFKLK